MTKTLRGARAVTVSVAFAVAAFLPAAPPATAAVTAAKPTCGAAANPWGYNFCGRGHTIAKPPATFCTYFRCIPSFWKQTKGYVMQCKDLTYSHSGGRSGSCSSHKGNKRALYG
jgi:hypothetical protein